MRPQPFLSFVFKGYQLSMINELPVSKPRSAAEVDRLVQDIQGMPTCPFYLEFSAEVNVVQVQFVFPAPRAPGTGWRRANAGREESRTGVRSISCA